MTLQTKRWDIVDQLGTEEKIFHFLEAAFEDGDASLIAAALGAVAKARGMTDVARQSGLSRENLYKSLSEEGNPEFATISKVVNALGYSLTVVAGRMWSDPRDLFLSS